MAVEYKPGDPVPYSGIYEVEHDKNHVKKHEVTVIYGRKFPPCRGCDHPRFTLVKAAVHIDNDANFKK